MFRKFLLENAYWIAPIALVLYTLFTVPTNDGFNSDSALKLFQAKGLLATSYSDQEVFYLGKKWDPDYLAHPNRKFLILRPDGGYWGQYSIFFAAVTAPILYLFGTSALVPFCILIYFLSIAIFKIIYKPERFTIFFALLCTPIFLYSLEYSENTLFLLFAGIGLSLYFKNPSLDWRFSDRFLAGFFLGVTVWFRLEPFIFIPALGLAILIAEYKRILSLDFWKGNGIFALGIILPILVFVFFNTYAYGSYLGPRFEVNSNVAWDISVKLKQLFVLAFFGYWKLGFFGYMPILLWVIFDRTFSETALNLREKVIILLLLIYIPLLSFSVSTEALVSWGPRYLSLCIFPGLFLLDDWYRIKSKKAFSKLGVAALIIFVSFSIAATLKGLSMIRASYKQIKVMSGEFEKYKTDYIVTGSEIISGHFGRLSLSIPCFYIRTSRDGEIISDRLFSEKTNKKIGFVVSKYKTKDIAQEMDGEEEDIILKFLKYVTPHVIQYPDITSKESGQLLGYFSRKSRLLESKETRFYSIYIFETK
ncbi:LA_3751/LA_3752 family putative glycosyltransferase [Leptospira venezuelensis]|uniref:LA_3751/LA_3752 family putative glycosyltransferase n=1 Tax=Leptospira venezuelensis TaxID=1958811 RepID=UPI000A35DD6F|nr:hypothetical protein [Leptospira venezuelensis]